MRFILWQNVLCIIGKELICTIPLVTIEDMSQAEIFKYLLLLLGRLCFLVVLVCLTFSLILLKMLRTGCIEILQRGSGGKRNKWLDFGSNCSHHADCPIRDPVITEQISRGVSWIF